MMNRNMTENDKQAAETFVRMIEAAGVEFTPENCLKCIGFAKDAMLAGECSVEAYYHAKNLLLSMVEVQNEWLN